MTYRPCAHCGTNYGRPADTDPAEPDYRLCPDCADAATYGAGCPGCGRVPSSRPCPDSMTAD